MRAFERKHAGHSAASTRITEPWPKSGLTVRTSGGVRPVRRAGAGPFAAQRVGDADGSVQVGNDDTGHLTGWSRAE